MDEPASVLLVTVPQDNGLNRLHLREGRLPQSGAADEAVVSHDFAAAHGLRQGSRLSVVMNGKRRMLAVTGIALSPEFIYALGPGEMMPDPRRFGVIWLTRRRWNRPSTLKGPFRTLSSSSHRGCPKAVSSRNWTD